MYVSKYTHAIIDIVNNDVRMSLSKKFIQLGYILSVLAQKSSMISIMEDDCIVCDASHLSYRVLLGIYKYR